MMAKRACLIVVPALDEERFIGGLLALLAVEAEEIDARLVVADGGSTDATREIVAALAASNGRIVLLHNPGRLQSAGVNLAVERFGDGCDYLIRVDAHAGYPANYCTELLTEAERTGAESVVVSMRTVGERGFQAAAAAAQSGLLGTGGSAHRMGRTGRWVEHGHHALMRIDAFRAVGGYDESFSHNEDAELDHRLLAAGGRIWMTGAVEATYHPRATVSGLFRQYFGYGRGRARNVLKHRALPRIRQAVPILVAPALALALLAPVSPLFLLPALIWLSACLAAALWGCVRTPGVTAALAGFAAAVMHLAWSAGFWSQILRAGRSASSRA